MNSSLFVNNSSKVFPGLRLAKTDLYYAGEGCYSSDKYITSSSIGYIQISDFENTNGQKGIKILSNKKHINNEKNIQSSNLSLAINDTCTGVIEKLTNNYVTVKLISINSQKISQNFEGQINLADVVEQVKDDMNIEDFFGVGDIVICKIKSLNESKKILLRTDKKNLGVIISRNVNGVRFVPWNRFEMIEPETGYKIKRKVAVL